MKLLTGHVKWLIIPLLAVMILSVPATGGTVAFFTDTEQSTGNEFNAWISTLWTQSTQADFNNGVLNNLTTFPDGHVNLSTAPNLSLIDSDNSAVTTTSTTFDLMKMLTFTRPAPALTKSGLTAI